MGHRRKNLFDEWDELLDIGLLHILKVFFDFWQFIRYSIASAWQGGGYEEKSFYYNVRDGSSDYVSARCHASHRATPAEK